MYVFNCRSSTARLPAKCRNGKTLIACLPWPLGLRLRESLTKRSPGKKRHSSRRAIASVRQRRPRGDWSFSVIGKRTGSKPRLEAPSLSDFDNMHNRSRLALVVATTLPLFLSCYLEASQLVSL